MKTIQIFSFLLLALFCVSCSSTVRVSSDYNQGTNFKQFTSYELIAPENLSDKVSLANKARIEKRIQKEMQNRQFQKVESDPDLSVSYFVIVNTVRDVETYVDYYGRRRWGYAVISSDVHEYKEGTLIIDLIDNKTQEVIWHGTASGTVIENQKDVERKIDEAVKAIFEKYSKQADLAGS